MVAGVCVYADLPAVPDGKPGGAVMEVAAADQGMGSPGQDDPAGVRPFRKPGVVNGGVFDGAGNAGGAAEDPGFCAAANLTAEDLDGGNFVPCQGDAGAQTVPHLAVLEDGALIQRDGGVQEMGGSGLFHADRVRKPSCPAAWVKQAGRTERSICSPFGSRPSRRTSSTAWSSSF